jgi:hypothetical protein
MTGETKCSNLRNGLDPEVVGQQVFDAISNNQFWLFTDEDWDEPIAVRADQIAQRSAPRLQRPSQQ